MKIFYFLDDGITQDDYTFFQEKLNLYKNGLSIENIIQEYYYKIGQDNKGRINKGFFLEAMTFIDFASKELKVELSDIQWIYKQNFLIHNRDFYLFDKDGFQKINIAESYFVTLRYGWMSQFFHILKNSGGNMLPINKRWDWMYNDKLYFVNKLYAGDISKFFGDIIIPVILDGSAYTYQLLYDFILSNFHTEIVVKKSFGEMGAQVRAIDLSSISFESFVDIMKKNFITLSNTVWSGIYILPYYNIEKEYRLYCLYHDNKVNIYAAKQKNTNFENIFQKESFELRKSVDVSRSYVDPAIIGKELYKYVNEIFTLTGFETGVLEMGITDKGEYRFFELNPFGGSLMFQEDQKYMYDFYYNMYKNKFTID